MKTMNFSDRNMANSPIKTKWDTVGFDDQPRTDGYHIRFVQKFSGTYLEKANRMLDIGCGIGSFTYTIDRDECFGIDLQLDPVKIAKKYCKKAAFLVASAMTLPFRDGTFDLVFIWGVFEQLPNGAESQVIREVHRILINGGTVLFSAGNNHFVTKIMDPGFLLRGQRFYEEKKLTDLLMKIGYSVKQNSIRGRWATLIANDLMLFYKHVLRKKEGKILRYFNKKSEQEFNSTNGGIVSIIIAAEKNSP